MNFKEMHGPGHVQVEQANTIQKVLYDNIKISLTGYRLGLLDHNFGSQECLLVRTNPAEVPKSFRL